MVSATVAGIFPVFRSTDVHPGPNGTTYVTTLDRDTDDFAHLIGAEVIINGALVTVVGVERFAHSPPWRRGEDIGLMVKV